MSRLGEMYPGVIVRLKSFKNYFDVGSFIEHKMNRNHKKTVGVFVFLGYAEIDDELDMPKLKRMLEEANLKVIEDDES